MRNIHFHDLPCPKPFKPLSGQKTGVSVDPRFSRPYPLQSIASAPSFTPCAGNPARALHESDIMLTIALDTLATIYAHAGVAGLIGTAALASAVLASATNRFFG